MINTIHLDIDNTLLYSAYPTENVGGDSVKIELNNGEVYETVVRKCAQDVIDFCRDLVGEENVYLLTLGTKEYARILNQTLGWQFKPLNIRAREDWAIPYRVGYGYADPMFERRSPNNILVDNLPYRENEGKCNYLGIKDEQSYFKVRDFYGINFPNDSFLNDLKKFLIERSGDCLRQPKKNELQ